LQRRTEQKENRRKISPIRSQSETQKIQNKLNAEQLRSKSSHAPPIKTLANKKSPILANKETKLNQSEKQMITGSPLQKRKLQSIVSKRNSTGYNK